LRVRPKALPPFTIVARIGNTGVTERRWRNDDSPFAIRFDLHLSAQGDSTTVLGIAGTGCGGMTLFETDRIPDCDQ
jgi:hypothetical protein